MTGVQTCALPISTVGSAQVSTYGGQYDQYWRLHYPSKQNKSEIRVQTGGDPIYSGKHRNDGEPVTEDFFLPWDFNGQKKFWMDRIDEAGIDLNDPILTGYVRACLYGELGTGKTRLALSAPFGPIVYLAVDKNSEFLRSMARELKVPLDA